MFNDRVGPDPYVFYKFEHAWRAEMAWKVSEDLGFYEALREGPSTIEEICARTRLQRRPVNMLLAANACMGIIGSEHGRYFIFDIQREFVLEGGRAYDKPYIPDDGEDQQYDFFKQGLVHNHGVEGHIAPWIKTPQGAPGVTAHVPSRHGWRILWGESLAAAFDFTAFHVVADMGGATGGVLVGLTGKYPHLKGYVVDLPYSRESAELALKDSQATDRVSFVTADFFKDPLPEQVDVFFMSHVIHDWDDDTCRLLLGRCHEALPVGSPVIVQEFLLNEDKSGSLLAVFQWLGMVRSNPGDQRTAKEIAALMEQSGFQDMETRAIDTEQSIVIGWKKK